MRASQSLRNTCSESMVPNACLSIPCAHKRNMAASTDDGKKKYYSQFF